MKAVSIGSPNAWASESDSSAGCFDSISVRPLSRSRKHDVSCWRSN